MNEVWRGGRPWKLWTQWTTWIVGDKWLKFINKTDVARRMDRRNPSVSFTHFQNNRVRTENIQRRIEYSIVFMHSFSGHVKAVVPETLETDRLRGRCLTSNCRRSLVLGLYLPYVKCFRLEIRRRANRFIVVRLEFVGNANGNTIRKSVFQIFDVTDFLPFDVVCSEIGGWIISCYYCCHSTWFPNVTTLNGDSHYLCPL